MLTEILWKINEKYVPEVMTRDEYVNLIRESMIDTLNLTIFPKNNSEGMFAILFDKDFEMKQVNFYMMNEQFMELILHE